MDSIIEETCDGEYNSNRNRRAYTTEIDKLATLIGNAQQEEIETKTRSRIQTYSAGEEKSRLAKMAKEFGLSYRQPKNSKFRNKISNIIHDSTFEYSISTITERVGIIEEDDGYSCSSIYDDDDLTIDDSICSDFSSIIEEKKNISGGSLASSLFGTVKGLVGATILYFPHGFSKSGYAFALCCLSLISILYLYSSDRLLDCWRSEMAKRNIMDSSIFSPSLGSVRYGSTSNETSQSDGSKNNDSTQFLKSRLKEENIKASLLKRHCKLSYPALSYIAFGKNGEHTVMTGIALMQLGQALTYLIFVAQNLHESFLYLFSVDFSFWIFILIMAIVELPLACIRDVRKFAVTNKLALFLIAFGVICCLFYALTATSLGKLSENISNLPPTKNSWYLFVGLCVFLFQCSITLCIPFQEAIEGEEARKKFPSLYRKVIITAIVLLCFLSIICWSAFGNSVKIVLTNSLPTGVFPSFVRLLYSIAVSFILCTSYIFSYRLCCLFL